MSPANVPASVLASLGIAVLAYRVYLTLGGEFGLQAREVAVLSGVRVATASGGLAIALGIVEVFDFSRAHSLLRQRVDAQLGILLVTIGAALSVGGLLAPRGNTVPGTVIAAFGAGIAGAWIITKGYRGLWWRLRERWWLAHCWLAWLERQIANPLAPSLNVSQDIIHVVLASQHPDLDRFINDRASGWPAPLTVEDRDAIERWIADFARRWRYRFRSKKWHEWASNVRGESR